MYVLQCLTGKVDYNFVTVTLSCMVTMVTIISRVITTLVLTPDDVQGEMYPIKSQHFITTFTVIVNYSVGIPLHTIMLTLLFYYGNYHKDKEH